MSILVCSTKYGGCGFIGDALADFGGVGGDIVICNECGMDHAFQLTKENLVSLTSEDNIELGRMLIEGHRKVVGVAKCGCVYHAEDGIPCRHDIALARERFCAQEL